MFCFTDPLHAERDVLVTGVGLVTPLGVGREESWRRLLAGERGGSDAIRFDDQSDAQLQTLLRRRAAGAPVDRSQLAALLARRMAAAVVSTSLPPWQADDVLISLISYAALEACEDANLRSLLHGNTKAGCVIGTSKSSLAQMEAQCRLLQDGASGPLKNGDGDGRRWANVFRSDAPLQAVRQLTGISGPGSCPVAACATGLISVIQAAEWVRTGLCDVCLAGSVDASLRPSVLASFHRLGVLSHDSDAATACRPFDENRDGFIIGEGAAVLVLESRRHAERREATAYGRLLSGGWLSDPTGLTQIDVQGTVVSELLKRLIAAIGNDAHIDHINLHGTGTEPNDLAEARGLRSAFGSGVPVCSAVKGSIGHLLGGAGSVELAMTLLGLRDQVIPPCVNLQTLDERCDIPLIGGRATPHSQQIVAKLSLGFGGHVAGCVLERTAT
ncbi:MAG: beta-ketoacyl-[acyl-carrier-protein] synthase family protein [Planctomycetaceae bacterium]